jgi:putative DNA methylase
LNIPTNQPIVILDEMAGGGVIPLEGIRYGFKVFTNDLNPVAATILKATTEYPAHFGKSLSTTIEKYAREIYAAAKARLLLLFPFQPADEWWLEEQNNARRKFSARSIRHYRF